MKPEQESGNSPCGRVIFESYGKIPLLADDPAAAGAMRIADIRRCSIVEVGEEGFYRYPEHIHVQSEIMFALEGEYRCILNGEPLTVPAGSAVMIQMGDRHEDCCAGPTVFLNLFFGLSDLSEKAGVRIFDPGWERERVFDFAGDPHFQKVIEAVVAEADVPENIFRQRIFSAFADILLWKSLLRLRRQLSRQCLAIFEGGFFRRRVLDLFAARLNGKLSVDEMAGALGISRRALSYKFREQFGCGPARGFMAYKIRYAGQLRRQGMSAKQVAAALGFANQFHFSRVFRTYSKGNGPFLPG